MSHIVNNISALEAKERLVEGNRHYLTAHQNPGDISPEIRRHTFEEGQHPYAIVVCCSDSRVVPEDIFMTGIGEIFTIRVAGNIISKSQMGSIEYAADHLGCHLVLIMGHTACGAVDSAINSEPEGFTKFLTDEVKRMIGSEKDPYKASCINAKAGAKLVDLYLKPKERPEGMELVVLPCIYHTDSGEVEFIG